MDLSEFVFFYWGPQRKQTLCSQSEPHMDPGVDRSSPHLFGRKERAGLSGANSLEAADTDVSAVNGLNGLDTSGDTMARIKDYKVNGHKQKWRQTRSKVGAHTASRELQKSTHKVDDKRLQSGRAHGMKSRRTRRLAASTNALQNGREEDIISRPTRFAVGARRAAKVGFQSRLKPLHVGAKRVQKSTSRVDKHAPKWAPRGHPKSTHI